MFLGKRKRLLALLIVAAATLSVAGAGEALIRPALRTIGAPPPGLPAQAVILPIPNGERVSGWFVEGRPHAGAILLLHGVRADRRAMLSRAEFLHRQGYAILLIDLPGHGESAAQHITFGLHEAEGVRAALRFLQQALPSEKIGVIGVSLGAASLVLSRPDPQPSAIILESMYPTIAEAVSDRIRLRLGAVGASLAPLLLWQLPLRLGISPDELRPIAALPALRAPLLIMAGSNDRHTTLAETQKLYDAANPPRELWVVEGAAHVNLHAFAGAAYEAKVSAFFAEHLRQTRTRR